MWIVLSALYSFSLYFFIHDSPDKQWKSWLWWGSWWFECWTRYAAGVYINVSGCNTSGKPSHYILHKEATKSKQDLSNTKLNPIHATTYSLMQRRSLCSLFCLSRTLAKVLGQFCVLIWFACIRQIASCPTTRCQGCTSKFFTSKCTIPMSTGVRNGHMKICQLCNHLI